MVDIQDSNLCNSGILMIKILNMVMNIVVTTWHMGVTPNPPLSLDQLVNKVNSSYQNPKTHLLMLT